MILTIGRVPLSKKLNKLEENEKNELPELLINGLIEVVEITDDFS